MIDAQPRAARVPWPVRGLVLLLIAYGAARFATAGILPAIQSLNGDFGASFPTAYFARWRPDFPTGQVWEGWNYWPMFHFLTLPLLAVPHWSQVPKVWAFANGIALVISFVLIGRLSRVAGRVSWWAIGALAGLWLLFQPLANCFAQGNIEILELLIVLAGLTLMDRGRGYASGAFIGTAAMIKLLPIGFLAWFLLRGKWRAVVAGAIVVVASMTIAAVTLEWKNNIFFQRSALVTQDPVTGLHELSITSLFAHRAGVLDADLPGVRWFPSTRVREPVRAGRVASVALAGVFGLLLIARRRAPVTPFDVSMIFLAMFMVIPWNHDYYYVFALVPLSVLLLTAIATDNRWLLAGVVAAYLLISPPIPFGLIDRVHLAPAPVAYLVNFYDLPVFGGLLLWILATHRILTADRGATTSPSSLATWRWAAVGAAVIVLTVTVAAAPWRTHRTNVPKRTEIGPLTFDPPIATGEARALALSPDGSRLAYVALTNGATTICTRPVEGSSTQCLPDTTDARAPFFSPDGQTLGFVRHDEIWVASLRDGTRRRLVSASDVDAPSWDVSGSVLYTDSYGIRRVAPTGGKPEVVIEDLDGIYTDPVATDDPDVILLTYLQRNWSTGIVMAWSAKAREMTMVTHGNHPHLDPASGRLVYAVSGAIVTAPYDSSRRQITAAAVSVVPSVLVPTRGAAAFAVSASGAVVFAPGTNAPAIRRTLAWVDRQGRVVPLPIAPNGFDSPRLSHDDRQFAVAVADGSTDVWTFELPLLRPTRVPSESAINSSPSWRPLDNELWLMHASGGGTVIDRATPPTDSSKTLMWQEVSRIQDAAWSPDGQWLATMEEGDIVILRPPAPSSKFGKAVAFIRIYSPGTDRQPVFSPDARWLAFTSDQSGRDEVYVRPLVGPGDPIRVSVAGGHEPVWNPNGRELFYRVGDSLQVVDVRMDDSFRAGTPREVARGSFASDGINTNYDVTHDGQRFLMVMAPASFPQEVRVIRGWAGTLPK